MGWLFVAAASEGSGPLDWTTLSQAGVAGILAAIVVAFVKGWIVPGSQHKEVCAQRDQALEQVYKLAAAAQRTIEATERRLSP